MADTGGHWTATLPYLIAETLFYSSVHPALYFMLVAGDWHRGWYMTQLWTVKSPPSPPSQVSLSAAGGWPWESTVEPGLGVRLWVSGVL